MLVSSEVRKFMQKSDIFHKNWKQSKQIAARSPSIKWRNSTKLLIYRLKLLFKEPSVEQEQILLISYPCMNHQLLTLNQCQPGPGSYQTQTQKIKGFKQAIEIFKFQIRIGHVGNKARVVKGKEIIISPGPGNYHGKISDRVSRGKSAPKIIIGSSKRPPLISGTALTTPGPGKYEFKSKILEMPGIKFKGSTNLDSIAKEKQRVPGSGTYEPKIIPKERAPMVKIGTSQRHDFTKNKEGVPAPGTYQIQERPQTPQYSFPKGNRPPLSAPTNSPGPGGYFKK